MRTLAVATSAALALAACSNAAPPTGGGNGPPYSLGTIVLDTTADVNGSVAMARDSSGNLHVIYAAAAGGLRYATCPTSCVTPAEWHRTAVDSALGSGATPSLAPGPANSLHAAYQYNSGATHQLRYATCAATCTDSINWQVAVIDPAGGYTPSILVDGSGTVTIIESDLVHLAVATCTATCTNPANWLFSAIDSALYVAGGRRMLTSDPAGALHTLYVVRTASAYALRHAACAASCATGSNWTHVTLADSSDSAGAPSLHAASNGALHAVFYGPSGLVYARCDSNCGTIGGWKSLHLAAGAAPGFGGLAVNGTDAYVSYRSATGALIYGECPSLCLAPGQWTFLTADSVSASASSALWANGAFDAGAVYLRASSPGLGLRYAQFTPNF